METNKIFPLYDLDKFQHVHREKYDSTFGYSNLDAAYKIPGFELYSSQGLKRSVGPLKSDFYRMSITCEGTLDMQIGLQHYKHQPRTVSFTHPHQLFAKNNISDDAFGYYMLFNNEFLEDLVPTAKFTEQFPFFTSGGRQVFVLDHEELQQVVEFVIKIDTELKQNKAGKYKVIQMLVYLILIQTQRSYERQALHQETDISDGSKLAADYLKLVTRHYLNLRQVTDYAEKLAVTPGYLNRSIKIATGKTASQIIKEMVLMEAKSQLKYTEQSISEVGYGLGFSDPASFNRFFKAASGITPLTYRQTTD